MIKHGVLNEATLHRNLLSHTQTITFSKSKRDNKFSILHLNLDSQDNQVMFMFGHLQ